MDIISRLRSSLSFAVEMKKKYIGLRKEWNANALTQLEDYCKGKITTEDYCAFIRGYNKVLLCYDYWVNEVSWLAVRIMEVRKQCRP